MEERAKELLLCGIHQKELCVLVDAILAACREIAHGLRDGENNGDFSTDAAGMHNTFGDKQLNADLAADAIMFRWLKSTALVDCAASEESPEEISCGGENFSVAFDPLDGRQAL
eukprot:UC4_evm1s562